MKNVFLVSIKKHILKWEPIIISVFKNLTDFYHGSLA